MLACSNYKGMSKVRNVIILLFLLLFPISEAGAAERVSVELGKAQSINITSFKDKLKEAADKTTSIMNYSAFSIENISQNVNSTNIAVTSVDKSGNIINKLNGVARNFVVDNILYENPNCPNRIPSTDPRCVNSKMIVLTQIERDVINELGLNSSSNWLKLNLREIDVQAHPKVSYSKEDVIGYWSSNLFEFSNIVVDAGDKSEISIFIDEANAKAALTSKNDILPAVKYIAKRFGGKFIKNIYTAPSGSVYNIKLVNDKAVLVKIVKDKQNQSYKAAWYPSKSNKLDGKLVISNTNKDKKVVSYEFLIYNGAVVSTLSRNGNESTTTSFSVFDDTILVPVLEVIDLNVVRENDLFKAKMAELAVLAKIEHDRLGDHEHN